VGFSSLFFYARNLGYGVRFSGLCAYVGRASDVVMSVRESLHEMKWRETKYALNGVMVTFTTFHWKRGA